MNSIRFSRPGTGIASRRMFRLSRPVAVAGGCIAFFCTAAPGLAAAPPPSSAIGDSCLVGRWVETQETAPGIWTWNNELVPMRGLAGLVVTFSADCLVF
jgi:hypothetical protein